jgi:hypothetical protein
LAAESRFSPPEPRRAPPVNSRRSARFVWAFSIISATLSFLKFWAPITAAVLAL